MSGSDGRIAMMLALAAAIVYVVATFGHPSPYDYFGRLAIAFTHGQWWLDDAPAYLDELVVGVGGHPYSLVPPLPALLLVPIVPFVASPVAQTTLSALAGALSAAPLYLAQRALGIPLALAIWTTMLSTFGTTLFMTAIDGRSWFAADALAFACCALALWLAAARAPALLVGVALGAAMLTRGPLLLAAPALLLLHTRGRPRAEQWRAALGLTAGAVPFVVAYVAYDIARWGGPLDTGYATFAGGDPFYSRGLWSIAYLPRHMYAMFLAPPAFVDGDLLFLRARSIGMSLLIATPAFLWIARAALAWRSLSFVGTLALGCLTLLPDVFFGTVGFEQYAYRRSLDAQAFLVPLVAVGGGWRGGAWLESGTVMLRAAIVGSIAITFYFFVAFRLHGFA